LIIDKIESSDDSAEDDVVIKAPIDEFTPKRTSQKELDHF